MGKEVLSEEECKELGLRSRVGCGTRQGGGVGVLLRGCGRSLALALALLLIIIFLTPSILYHRRSSTIGRLSLGHPWSLMVMLMLMLIRIFKGKAIRDHDHELRQWSQGPASTSENFLDPHLAEVPVPRPQQPHCSIYWVYATPHCFIHQWPEHSCMPIPFLFHSFNIKNY